MSLLTEQEMTAFFPFGLSLCVSDIRLVRAIESKMIEKIKTQGPDMLYHGRCAVDCGEYGHPNVELLKLIPAGTKLYKLPNEGD